MLHSKLTLIAAALALWTTNVRADIESIRAKAQALDKRAQQIMELSEGLKKQVETTGQQVQEKVEKIKALRENLDQLTDDAKRRAELLKSGEEAKQLESLKGAEGLGDEAILLAGTAAKGSKHTKVRRKAIDLAVSLGSEGYAALAFSFESLAAEDRTYAVEQLAKGGAANLVILVAAAREADLSTRAALFKAGAAIGGEQGLLLIVAASKDLDAKLAEDFAKAAGKLQGDDGLTLLYFQAKNAESTHKIAALRVAVERKTDGLVVLAAALKSEDPKVRTELVRAARKIGGDDAQFIMDRALKNPNEALRKAAEEGLKDPKEPKSR